MTSGEQVCDQCGEPFDEAHSAPHRFEIGPFVGKVVHSGDCEVNMALADDQAQFEKRPKWQRRLIRRTAGPPPWER